MFPLDEFYAERGDAVPQVDAVEGPDLPQPYQQLLVHERDMTTTLEQFFGEPMVLRLLDVRRDGAWLRRQVVLLTKDSRRPVEFGAIRIDLSSFSSLAVRDIVQCHIPLGAILHQFGVSHSCRPSAFFKFQSDPTTRSVFGLMAEATLYGRHTLLYDRDDRTLAEVVEILPLIDPGETP
jgi:hypothetical protein